MLNIITAEQRLAEKKGPQARCLWSVWGGQDFLLPEPSTHSKTLFMDLEAGDAAIEGVAIDVIRPRTWQECRDFAVFLGGPNPSLGEDATYSQMHYDYVCQTYGDPADVLSKYDTIFVDSITVAARLCFVYCQNQPECKSENELAN